MNESSRVKVASFLNPHAKLDGDRLSIATVNLARQSDAEHVVNSLRARFGGFKPEIVVLQEMMCGRLRHSRATVAEIIASEFGYNVVSFARNGLVDREAVAILSSIPFDCNLDGHGSEAVRGAIAAYDLAKEWSAEAKVYQRLGLTVDYRHPKLGRIRVNSIHLAHHETFAQQRKAQLKQLLGINESRDARSQADVIFLAGDFNTGYGEAYYAGEFSAITDRGFKQDASQVSTWTSADGSTRSRLDYVFWKGSELTQESEFVGELDFSDHRCVVCHFKCAPTETATIAEIAEPGGEVRDQGETPSVAVHATVVTDQ